MSWIGVARAAAKRFLADNCTGLSQQIAFSSLLAFFPAMIALVGLLDLIGAYSALERFLDPVAPKAVTDLIATFRKDSGGAGSIVALTIGAIAALWAASGAVGSVVKAVNRAYEETESRPFWKVRLISLALTIAMGFATAATLLLIVLGGTLGDALARHGEAGRAVSSAWDILRWPIAFCLVLALFAVIYTVAPDHARRSWRAIAPGSVVGAVLWLALSGLFAVYTSFSNSYTKTYGTLATGIVLLLWLNYTAWAILFGAELNAQLERER